MSRPAPRTRLLSLLTFVRSRRFSFLVLGAWVAMLTVWVLPFILAGQSEATIQSIGQDWWAFRLIYAALLLSTGLCTVDRIARDLRRLRIQAPDNPAPARRRLEEAQGIDLDQAAQMLEGAGFSVDRADDSLRAMRHPRSVLGGAVFHGSLCVIALGIAVHALTFESATFQLTETQPVGEESTAAEAGVPAGLHAAVSGLRLAEVRPVFHEDVLLFKTLEAVFLDAAGKQHTMSLSSPWWLDPVTTLSIQDFGYSPEVTFVSAQGESEVAYSGPMSLFPPGSEDQFFAEAEGLEVVLRAYPDYTVVDGRDASASYNLRNPRLLVSVQAQGGEPSVIARRLVAIGEPVRAAAIGSETEVMVTALRKYGSFRITRSYGLPFMALGFLLAFCGLAARTLFPRVDVIAWRSGQSIVFDAWADVFGREAGVALVRRLMEEAR